VEAEDDAFTDDEADVDEASEVDSNEDAPPSPKLV